MPAEPIRDDVFVRLIDEASGVAAQYAGSVDAEGRYPSEAIAALRRLGLLNLLVPVDLGGSGGTLPQFVEAVRRLAQACGATALCYAMHVGARSTLVHQADDPGVAGLVRASCAAGGTCTIAVSPGRGADGTRRPMELRRAAGGFVLDGRKAWCTGIVEAAELLVYVTADAGGDVPVPALLWVRPHHTPGFRVEETWKGTGMRGSRSDTAVFVESFIPHGALIGDEGGGDVLLSASDAPTLLGLAAASLGCGEAAVRTAAGILAGRLEPGATPPPIAFELVSADLGLRAAAAAVEQAAHAAAVDPGAARPAILAAKVLANLAAATAADVALAAAGASGYQRGTQLERQWRDAHAGRLMVPTPDDCRVVLARTLLGWPS